MAFDLSTATPVDEVPKDDSGLLPKPNDFPAVTKRAKQNKETDVQRLEQLTTPDLTEAAALVPGVASDFGSQAGNLGQGAFNYIKEHPLASAAVGGAAALGGQAVYKTLKDKILGGKTPNASPNAEPELFSRIDPDLNVSQKPVVRPEPTFDMQGMTPAQPVAQPVAQSTPTTIEELKARLTATPEVPVAPVAQAPVDPRIATTIPSGVTETAPQIDTKFAQSDALLADINNELKSLKETIPATTDVTSAETKTPVSAPTRATAPVKPTTNVTLQPTGELPKQLAEVKGSIPPRVQNAAAAVPPEVQAKYAPEGKVVLKGYGSGDVSITNTYGKNAYAAIVDYFNNGQPIGTDENYKIVQGKINKGIPSELAPFFASKLPASEADAGTFGSKALGEKIGYTPQGKVVTSPNAIKNAVAKGGSIAMVLAVADAAHAAGEGDYSKTQALPLAAVPGVGAGLGLYHGEAGAPTITQRDDALKRPEVRKTLETLKQTLSPAEYEKAARQYLNKVGSFSGMTDRERLMADIQSPYRQLPSRNTLLPVAPPR